MPFFKLIYVFTCQAYWENLLHLKNVILRIFYGAEKTIGRAIV